MTKDCKKIMLESQRIKCVYSVIAHYTPAQTTAHMEHVICDSIVSQKGAEGYTSWYIFFVKAEGLPCLGR